jgi:5-methyltetrahydrofolate--homocysteine methyltransferase
MRSAYTSYRALRGLDENCADYIAFHTSAQAQEQAVASTSKATQQAADASAISAVQQSELAQAIKRGMCKQAGEIAAELIKSMDSLDIINEQLVPALDEVGSGFERGKVFLPQLLMSADAAKAAFDSIKAYLINNGEKREARGKVVIATVKGDIHDIGKNIVKVLLENYGFEVIDLGKDVPPEAVVEAVKMHDVKLVGLSALMTTTVGAMEETIKQLREAKLPVKVMVGGAVLTQEYADKIGADFYSKDAMGAVRYACENCIP